MCPGKKEFVSVKLNGIKQHIQKRLLLFNLKELHVQCLEKNNDIKLDFQNFASKDPSGASLLVVLQVYIQFVFVSTTRMPSC